MIVDASAIVAILAGETDAERLSARLRAARSRFTHAVSVYEAVLALCRLNRIPVEVAHDDLDAYLAAAGIEIAPFDDMAAVAALDAFSRYGRGRHPAKLNMGDCFSYACAKLRGMPLLYTGTDFALTDLA